MRAGAHTRTQTHRHKHLRPVCQQAPEHEGPGRRELERAGAAASDDKNGAARGRHRGAPRCASTPARRPASMRQVGPVETCSQPPVTVADHGHGHRVPARLVLRRAASLRRTWRPEPPGPLGGRNTGSIPGRELRGRSRRPGERANALARTRSGTGPRPCCARAARPRMGAPQGGAWRPPPCGAGPGLLTAGGRRFACSLGWLTHRCSPRAALVH